MIASGYLPKFPPVGDVTTELGVFRLAASRIIHQLDDHLRYEYTMAPDTIDAYLTAIRSIFDSPNIRNQLASVAKHTLRCIENCVELECVEVNRHELMFRVVELIADMPLDVYDERKSKGILVGYSMN